MDVILTGLTLVLAEKPSVAQAIAKVLKATARKDGYLQGDNYIVSWCFGHLVDMAQPEAYSAKYAKWSYEDLPIIPEKWKYAVDGDRGAQMFILSGLMKSPEIDTVVCATDAGREGELIFRRVYEYAGCKKPVKRLWIQSMEESAILEGFRNLKDWREYDNLYYAAVCRARADWIIGYSMTRLFSVLYRHTLHVGRVQTPTLAMLVNRERDITAFVPKPFYTPEIDCGGVIASGERLFSQQEADNIRAVCDGKAAHVVNIERIDKTAAPPKLYDLTTLQREANRLFGYTAQQTLDCVQTLYEKKLTTYPRTDSNYLTSDMAETVKQLVFYCTAKLPGFFGQCKIAASAEQVIDDSKVTDHHAIIPTMELKTASIEQLPTAERDILNMIMARLLCAVGEKHTYMETKVTLDCEGYTFTAGGKTVLHDGWKSVERIYHDSVRDKPRNTATEETILPEVSEGQRYENVRVAIKEGSTTPPKRFTEDTLLSAMENAGDAQNVDERRGLGTPATRAGIIERLIMSSANKSS